MKNNMIDASSNTADYIQQIIDAGVTRVGRYYNKQNSTGKPSKCLTLEEAKSLCAAGLSLVVVYQQKQDSIDCFSEKLGEEAAKNALDCAKRIGQPEGTAIYFSVDFDATLGQLEESIIPFFQGVNDVFNEPNQSKKYKVGVYGSGLVCDSLFSENLAFYCWLSQSTKYNGTQAATVAESYNILQQPPSYTEGNYIGTLAVDYDQALGTIQDVGAFQIPIEYKVTAKTSLNMRDQPSTEGSFLASIPGGTVIKSAQNGAKPSMNPEWPYVQYHKSGEPIYGYVSSEYLTSDY